jgi:hypothetical protein
MKKSELLEMIEPFGPDTEMEIAGQPQAVISLIHEDGKVKVRIDPKKKKRKRKSAVKKEPESGPGAEQ